MLPSASTPSRQTWLPADVVRQPSQKPARSLSLSVHGYELPVRIENEISRVAEQFDLVPARLVHVRSTTRRFRSRRPYAALSQPKSEAVHQRFTVEAHVRRVDVAVIEAPDRHTLEGPLRGSHEPPRRHRSVAVGRFPRPREPRCRRTSATTSCTRPERGTARARARSDRCGDCPDPRETRPEPPPAAGPALPGSACPRSCGPCAAEICRR